MITITPSGGDDAPNVSAAFASGNEVYLPYSVPGFIFETPIVMNNAGEIYGDEGTIVTLAPGMSSDVFQIKHGSVKISSLSFRGNGTQTNSLFKLKTSLATCRIRDVFIEDIVTRCINDLITDDNASPCTDAHDSPCDCPCIGDGGPHCVVVNLNLRRIYHRQPTGRTSLLYDAMAYLFMEKVFTDLAGTTNNVPAHVIINNQGCIIEDCEVDGNAFLGANLWGFDFENCNAVTLKTCQSDTLGGYGFRFLNVIGSHLTDIRASLCNSHGLIFINCQDINGCNIFCSGRQDIGGGLPVAPNCVGVYVTGESQNINLANVLTKYNSGPGVQIDNANGGASPTISSGVISDLLSRNNGGYGYVSNGASYSLLNGAKMSQNFLGDYSLSGASNMVANVLTDANVFVSLAHG